MLGNFPSIRLWYFQFTLCASPHDVDADVFDSANIGVVYRSNMEVQFAVFSVFAGSKL